MNIEKAMEIAKAIRDREPTWNTAVESGYGTQAHILIKTDNDIDFVIRSGSQDSIALSGIYGSLSKYTKDGDDFPRMGINLSNSPELIAMECQLFEHEVDAFSSALQDRCKKAKGDYDSRLEIANKLSHPGIKITNATDIWWKKKRFEVSGEILSGGNVSLSILCDGDTANMILELLKGVK